MSCTQLQLMKSESVSRPFETGQEQVQWPSKQPPGGHRYDISSVTKDSVLHVRPKPKPKEPGIRAICCRAEVSFQSEGTNEYILVIYIHHSMTILFLTGGKKPLTGYYYKWIMFCLLLSRVLYYLLS